MEPEALKNYTNNVYVRHNECSAVLNKFLCSKYFEQLLESLKNLEDTYSRYRNMVTAPTELANHNLNHAFLNCLLTEISEKYVRDVFEKAFELCDDVFPNGLSATEIECDAMKDINEAFDKGYEFSCNFKTEMGYCRFSVQENMLLLLNDIFPTSC